jgi:parvulin-like peptidyl-prolyl isomerase
LPPTSTPTATTIPTTTIGTSTPESPESDTSEQIPTLTEAPTVTPFSYEAYQELYTEVLASFEEDIGLSEKALHAILINELYRQKVKEVILADIICEQDQVWARHILVEDEETALEVLDKLEAGEDFAELAAQYSTDESNKDNGGDLSWFGTGRMVPEFEKIAFALNVGEISDPVETQFGWHIIQTLGHEVKALASFECDQMKEQEFTNWLEQQSIITAVETFDYWSERVPTEPSIPPNLSQF